LLLFAPRFGFEAGPFVAIPLTAIGADEFEANIAFGLDEPKLTFVPLNGSPIVIIGVSLDSSKGDAEAVLRPELERLATLVLLTSVAPPPELA
jgi:hypothetical protein